MICPRCRYAILLGGCKYREVWDRFGVVVYMTNRHIFIFDSSTSKANRLERKPILGAFELQQCVFARAARGKKFRQASHPTDGVFAQHLTGRAALVQVRDCAPAGG